LQPSTLAKRVPSLLLLAVTAFFFYGLGRFPLVGPDEPRYAQVAREMFLRGDLITPTLGGHAWFEKPVLLYWFMMVSYKLFGVTEFAARLGPALSGVLTVFAVYWAAQKVEVASRDEGLKNFGTWSGIVSATTLGLIVFSHAASFDILVTMTTTWALAFFFAAELETRKRRRVLFLSAFYALVGVSLLAKGLVGLLPIGVVGSFFLLRRKMPPRHVLFSIIWGLPLALGVAAVWFGPVIAHHGKLFIREFIIQHHFARYLTNKYHHPQPFLFYPVILVPMTLPWTPFFLNALSSLRSWHWRSDDPLNKLRVLSLVWMLLPLVTFSFSASKLPGYIVPVLPAIALLSGERLTRFVSTGETGHVAMRAAALLCILFAAGALFYARLSGALSQSCSVAIVLPLAIAGLIAGLWPRFRATAAVLIAASTVLASLLLLNCGIDKIAQRDSVARLIRLADERGYSNLRVGALHTIDRTAQFYASGRLLYGPDREPAKLESSAEVLAAARENNGAVLILAPLGYVNQLTSLNSVTADVIGDNGTMAIVAVSVN